MFDINVHRHGLCTLCTEKNKQARYTQQLRNTIFVMLLKMLCYGWQSSNLLPCNTLENHPSVIQIVKKHFLLDFRRQTLERTLFMLKMKIKSHF